MSSTLSFFPTRLLGHYNDHKDEFDVEDHLDYQDKARQFLERVYSDTQDKCVLCPLCMCYVTNDVHTCSSTDSSYYRLDPTTNEFAGVSAQGFILTYFVYDPSTHGGKQNLDYLHDQCIPRLPYGTQQFPRGKRR